MKEESALKRCFVAKLSLKIDVIGQIGALDFAVIHIIGFLDQTQRRKGFLSNP